MNWLKTWRKRRNCFHHDSGTAKTWIDSHIADFRKIFWCRECGKVWIF